MRQLLESGLELVIDSGFIYVPLLFDPGIEREIRSSGKTNGLAEVEGKLFIKTLSLRSMVKSYAEIHPKSYAQLRRECLRKYRHAPGVDALSIDQKLQTILFHVMPHFIRRTGSLERGRLSEEEILDLIGEKIDIPARYYEEAEQFVDPDALRRGLEQLEEAGTTIEPPADGPISAGNLEKWLHRVLELRIVEGEKERLRHLLDEREPFAATHRRHVATLLYIAESGALEIDGFGFARIGLTNEYLVYRRTGEYALKDFYGRIYLFPDCRVAVSTIVPLRPFVIDAYKHPFLEGYDSGQPICLRHFSPPREFGAANVIRALEEGISALLYGYSSRRRNGYHSLEQTTKRVWSVDSNDAIVLDYDFDPLGPTRYVRRVSFEDYCIPPDHPKIVSGQVQVTNSYTP